MSLLLLTILTLARYGEGNQDVLLTDSTVKTREASIPNLIDFTPSSNIDLTNEFGFGGTAQPLQRPENSTDLDEHSTAINNNLNNNLSGRLVSLTPLNLETKFPFSKSIDIIQRKNRTFLTLFTPDNENHIYNVDADYKVNLLNSVKSEGKCRFIKSKNLVLLFCPTKDSDNKTALKAIPIQGNDPNFSLPINHLEGNELVFYWTLDETLYIILRKDLNKMQHTYELHYYQNGTFIQHKNQNLFGEFYSSVLHFSNAIGDFILTLSVPSSQGAAQILTLYMYSSGTKTYEQSQLLSFDQITYMNHLTFKSLGDLVAVFENHYGLTQEDTIARLYLLKKDKLMLYQKLKIPSSPVEIISLLISGTPSLAVVAFTRGIYLYVHDGVKFVPTESSPLLNQPGYTSFRPIGQIYGATSLDSNKKSGLVLFRMEIRPLPSSKEMEKNLVHWMTSSMESLENTTLLLSAEASKAPINGSSYDVTHELTFQKDLSVQSDVIVPMRDLNMEEAIFNKLKQHINDLNVLESELIQIESNSSHCLNFSDVTHWPGSYEMHSVVIRDGIIDNLHSNLINNVSVPSENELFNLREQELPTYLNEMFFYNVEMKDATIKALNDKPIGSYVTLSGNHVILGRVHVRNLMANVINVGGSIDRIKVDSNSLLLTDGAQKISGRIECESSDVTDLRVDSINNIDLHLLFGATAENGNPIHFKDLHITGDLIFPNDLTVGTILGRDTKNLFDSILYKNVKEEQIVYGDIAIARANMKNLTLKNRLNKVPFSDSVFINSKKMNYLIEFALFTDVFAKVVVVQRSLNEIKVRNSELDVMTIKGGQVITGLKSFHSLHIDGRYTGSSPGTHDLQDVHDPRYFTTASNDLSNKMSNEWREDAIALYSLAITWARAYVLCDEKNTYTESQKAEKIFSNLGDRIFSPIYALQYANETLENAYEYLNQLPFARKPFSRAEGNLLHPECSNKLHSYIEQLQQLISAKKDKMSRLEQEMFSKRLMQRIPKHKLRKYLHGDSRVLGLVSGFNISHLISLNSSYDSFAFSRMDKAKKIILKNLNAARINDIDVERLFTKTLKLEETTTNLNMTFANEVQIRGNLNVNKLNDVQIKDYALATGINVFQDDVTFRELIRANKDIKTKGAVNGYRLATEAARLALLGGNQTIRHPIKLKSAKAFGVTSDSVSLRRVPLQDYILKSSSSAVVTGKKTFSDLVCRNNLKSEQMNFKSINGIDFGFINAYNKKASGTLNMKGTAKVSHIDVIGKLTIIKIFKNNFELMDLTRLLSNAARLDQDNHFPNKFIFSEKVFVKNLTFSGNIDGVAAATFNKGWLTTKGEIIKGKTFIKNLKTDELEIESGVLQGVDLSRLETKSAKITQDVSFLGGKVYFENLVSESEIEAKGLVQGHNLARDAILNREDVVIPVTKSFRKATLKRHLRTTGKINNMNIREICESAIGKVIIKGSLNVDKDVIVDKIRHRDALFPTNPSSFWLLDEATTLNEVVLDGGASTGLFVRNSINQIPVSVLTNDQSLGCNKVLEGKVKVKHLYSNAIAVSKMKAKQINGRSMDFIAQLLLHEDQTFTDGFFSSLKVDGSLKLLSTSKNFRNKCTKSRICQIEARKTFNRNLVVKEAVVFAENGTINHYPITHYTMFQPERLEKIIINSSFTVDNLRVDGLVNGIKFDDANLLAKSGNQSMSGVLAIRNSFNETVFLNVNVGSHEYNGFNLREFYSSHTSNDIKNDEDFFINLTKLLSDYRSLKENALQTSLILSELPKTFKGWEAVNTFKGEDLKVITPVLLHQAGQPHLVATISNTTVAILSYCRTIKRYKDSGIKIEVPGNCATDVKGFYRGEFLFVATSTDCSVTHAEGPDDSLIMYTDNHQTGHREFSYIWLVENKRTTMLSALSTSSAKQVQSLEIRGSGCFMFIGEGTTNQNIFCESNGKFIIRQKFNLGFAFQTVAFEFEGENYLIFASYLQECSDSKATIFKYREGDEMYINQQEIHSERIISLAAGEFRGSFYLVLIQEGFYGLSNGYLKIYRLKGEDGVARLKGDDDSRFELEQKISIDRPLEASLLKLPSNELLLLVLNEAGLIQKFVKRGIEKFQLDGSIYSNGATSISTWKENKAGGFFLSVAAKMQPDDHNQPSDSRILKAIFKGS